MLKKILAFILAALVAFVLAAFLLPRNVKLERSITIDAPQGTVFTLLSGFKRFNEWSPWYALEPTAKQTLEGPEFGVGAKMSWVGDKVGSGSQTITELKPAESIVTALDFGPQGRATARFTLKPEGSGTHVTWGFDTDVGNNPLGRYMGLMIPKFVGPDFEKGLVGLKKLAESLPKTDFTGLTVARGDTQPVTVAYLSTKSAKDDKAIAAAIGAAYMQVGAFMKKNGLNIAGAPQTINTKWDDTGYEFDAAIPVDKAPEKEVPADSPVKIKQTYAGKVLKAVHKGSYHTLSDTYAKLEAFAAATGAQPNGPMWDEYVSDPGNTPEAELLTNIYMPIR